MSTPLEIVFHHVDRSPYLERSIRERALRLAQVAKGITSFRVTVERPHSRPEASNPYQVRVDVRVAGAEIAMSRDECVGHSHENVYIALSDAFVAARRQLQDFTRKRQESH